MAIRFGSSSSIGGSDEMLGCESLPLSHVHSIKDGALRFCHVAHEEEALRNLIRLIVNRHLKFSYGSSNPSGYYSSYEQPRLIFLIKWIVIH